jgi:cytochrome c6
VSFGNIIIPEKNLKKETLEANGMNTISAISYQVINGKNGMPAFGGRLKKEIEDVATYVLKKPEKFSRIIKKLLS